MTPQLNTRIRQSICRLRDFENATSLLITNSLRQDSLRTPVAAAQALPELIE
jgi:hypothetical protein